jgi:hypothetical protein
MAHTLTVLTLWLAQAIGLYLIASGILLLTQPNRLAALVGEIEASPILAFLSGFAAFAVGVAILIPHHVTYDWLALVVTGIAAIACLEGLALIAAPHLMLRIARTSVAAPRLWGAASLILGLILALAGLTGHADAIP